MDVERLFVDRDRVHGVLPVFVTWIDLVVAVPFGTGPQCIAAGTPISTVCISPSVGIVFCIDVKAATVMIVTTSAAMATTIITAFSF